jgi:hypothetical protein
MHSTSQHFAGRLLDIIQNRADHLTRDTVAKLRSSPRTISYAKLSDRDLTERVHRTFENLGRWLWDDSESEIQPWYNELGAQRCSEGIPLKEVLWALVMTKYVLLKLVDTSALADSAIELYRKQEIYRLIEQFFDRASYFAAEGYEREAQRQAAVVETHVPRYPFL